MSAPPIGIDANVIPKEIATRVQWICWDWEHRDGRRTKPPKIPCPGDYYASTNKRRHWRSLTTAVQAAEHHEGIGFVITRDDPYVGLDFDKCRDPKTGVFDVAVRPIIERLAARSYGEISPSQTGVKFIVKGQKHVKNCVGLLNGIRVELFDHDRYFTVTTDIVNDDLCEINDAQGILDEICKSITWDEVKTDDDDSVPDYLPSPAMDDEHVLRLCRSYKHAVQFIQLYDEGDMSAFVDKDGKPDHSRADMSLVSKMSFFTQDVAQIIHLVGKSKLTRPKWTDREDYARETIRKVLRTRTETYQPVPDDESAIGDGTAPARRGKSNRKTRKPKGKAFNTEMGNAERLVRMYGKEMRRWTTGRWLSWDGKRWEVDDVQRVPRFAKLMVRSIYGEAKKCGDDDERQKLGKWAKDSEKRKSIENAIALASSDEGLQVRTHELDADPWLLNVKNGTIELRTGKLREHRREDLITKLAPVAYDPTATCPRWRAFLDTIFEGDTELIGFLQRAVGYSLTGDTREQCLFILHGCGSNGKSTFIDAVYGLLGNARAESESKGYARTMGSETLMVKRSESHPCDIAAMRGARFVVSSETEDGRRIAESLVKEMTGGSRLSARFMRQDFFTFKPELKLWLDTNHKPTIRGTDYAIWRRIRLVPFGVTIRDDEQDKWLGEKLANEASGILNWALEGCLAWQAGGLKPPKVVMDATAEYRSEMDVLGDFIAERCVVGPHDVRAYAADLYDAYTSWCTANGVHSVTSNRFGRQLTERGFCSDRETAGPRKGKKRWRGIGLRSDARDGDHSGAIQGRDE